ncbi:hypothetical protein ONZ45_g10565 [Pleurotus djamor]|nr:hypothetical protein ONZ45_g10565 [Pleurotus djamor]
MSSLDDQPPAHNTRSAIQIVWSCLFILFTCTWTAIHPNVPPAGVSSSKWQKLWWRIKIMLWTLMLPEMMVCWATYQWKQAQKISLEGTIAPLPLAFCVKLIISNYSASNQATFQSIPAGHEGGAHSQPAEMERALTLIGKSSPPTSSPDSNEKIQPQAEWTRTHSYFLLMGGFAVPDSPARLSWKPIRFTDILRNRCQWPLAQEADILNVTKGEALAKTIVVLQVIWFISQLCGRVAQHLAITELEVMTLAYAIICAMLYVLWFGKPYDVQRPIFLEGPSYHPSTPKSSALRFGHFLLGAWIWTIHGQIVGDTEFSQRFLNGSRRAGKARNLALLISATLFGGIHLLAWNFEFPTRLELLMWRIASFHLVIIP